MPAKRLLLLSNSRDPEGRFLVHPREVIREFLGPITSALFVPFATVMTSLDAYAELTSTAFAEMGMTSSSVHAARDGVRAVRDADAIVVGGGNTFQLLKRLYETRLLDAIRERVSLGVPYIGWSAGSVITAPTMRTTNDMPIVEPPSLDALGFVPFQINAHYTDFHPAGFQGETRVQRISEFLELNRSRVVVGLREGSMLRVEGDDVLLIGPDAVVFRHGSALETWAGGERKKMRELAGG
jgi:dipeptidase E